MQNLDDRELLRYCGTDRSDEAFSFLVSRHLDLVYSAALRQVRDPHLARDVSQSVFLLLARKARSLKPGTVLAGWLYRTTRFVVSETLRSENRRRARELLAMEPLSTRPNESFDSSQQALWQEIEPLLDDAVATLNEQDRDLVLLRYFQKRSLKEVGDRFGISEDAAQKRVTRALEKLRAFFAARGATFSNAALGTVIASAAVQAAPAGTVSAILTVAAPAAAITAGAATLTVQTLLEIMALTKTKAAIATAVLAALTVPLVTQTRALQESRRQNETLRVELEKTVAARPVRNDEEPPLISEADLARLRNEAAEVHRLRGEVTLLRQASRTESAPKADAGPEGQAGNNPMNRMNLGRDLMKQGKHREALEHFLWCFDEGLKHAPSFVGVRSSFLLQDLRNLAKVYPPAREAMLDRRDIEEQTIARGASDPAQVYQYHQLNEHLDEPARSLALFDQLPQGHRARAALVNTAMEQFLNDRRYVDIVDAGNPEATFDQARLTAASVAERRNGPGNEMINATIRRKAVESGAFALEALAGAGQLDRAIALAKSVLEFDGSPETRGQLLKHAQRAGQPEIVAQLQNALTAVK